MSGDAQPRKRKDKRRKKGHLDQRRTEEYAEEREVLRKLSSTDEPDEEEIYAKYTHPTDEIVHVHKDDEIGGNLCTKLIFFLLLAGIGIVVGLTLIEYRGTTDAEAGLVKDSAWVAVIQEWAEVLPFYGDQDGHDAHEHKEHDEHDEHNEHDENDEHDEHDEHEEHEEPEEQGEKSSWFSLGFGFGGDTQDAESSEVTDESSSWFSLDFNLLGSEKEEPVEESSSEIEEIDEIEEADERNDASLEQEEEEEDDDEKSLEEDDEVEEETENLSEQNLEDDEEQEEDVSQELDQISQEEPEDEEEPEEEDEPEYEPDLSAEQEEPRNFQTKKKEDDEISEEELFPEAIEALRREASELLEKAKDDENEIEEEIEKEQEQEQETGDDETEGMAVKFGVGVALIVVAHIVLVKKWNSWEEHPTTEIPPSPPSQSEEPQIVETIPELVQEPVFVPEPPPPEPEEEVVQEEEYEDEELSEDEVPINPNVYEKIIAKYGQPSPESSDVEQSDGDAQEYSDGDAESVGEEESENEVEESDPEELPAVPTPEESEYEEESEDESPPQSPTLTGRGGGPRSQEEVYQNADITNNDDWALRQELDMADEEFNIDRLDEALFKYEKVLQKHPKSPRANYGKAQILDKQAEMKRSNVILGEAIKIYQEVINDPNSPPQLVKQAGLRCINRMRFKGNYIQNIPVHKVLINKFQNNPEYRNDMGITYLMVNRLQDAEEVFKSVLKIWPKDATALSHYGLVLKLDGKMNESIPYLKEGLKSDIPATKDARLYFHLGDALARTGHTNQAMEVYENGVSKGLFRSKFQRSLYNVDTLKARPWWTHQQTTYAQFFKKLEDNWKIILNEGLAALKSRGGFKDEAENLRDVGDWKQFELFARGVKYKENCLKTPKTCSIIEEFEPARSCKRGQSKFSVMEAGTHVWAHCGPTNCRLRSHLGLIVPKNTYIRVADKTRTWEEGKVLIFDDSFEHEVWHNGTSHRLVLIVDVWHPELTRHQRLTLSPI